MCGYGSSVQVCFWTACDGFIVTAFEYFFIDFSHVSVCDLDLRQYHVIIVMQTLNLDFKKIPQIHEM